MAKLMWDIASVEYYPFIKIGHLPNLLNDSVFFFEVGYKLKGWNVFEYIYIKKEHEKKCYIISHGCFWHYDYILSVPLNHYWLGAFFSFGV